MIDERLKTRDESGSTSSPTKRHPEHREGSIKHLSSLSLSMGLLLISLLILAACTDYVQKMDDGFDEWEQAQQQAELSSSSQVVKSSSSVKSSKSSSSVFLSSDSREKSSSNTEKKSSSSSSKKTSSSSIKLSSSNKVSSSSEQKNKSSSSLKASSSSSKVTSSSSLAKSSSSSAKAVSSSSKKNEVSSSSKEVESSSSGKVSWAYLNPAISYGEMTDNRDGQVYKTVKIGEQTWMAENLNFEVANSDCYKDSAIYCAKYGRLYTWTAAKEVCPANWHLPDSTECAKLFDAVGGQYVAGTELKSIIDWVENGNGGVDVYGFSAIPAGYKNKEGEYGGLGEYANFWPSTEYNDEKAYLMFFYYGGRGGMIGNDYKDDLYSVRCIKNENPKSSSSISSSSSSKASWAYLNPAISYGEIVDDRDGQVYKTVEIGEQTWMAENLNYEIEPYKVNYEEVRSFCYNDSVKYCEMYGRLYTWQAAKRACPTNWRLPTNAEFHALVDATGGMSIAGKMLRAFGANSGCEGTNDYGFSGFPSGMWDDYDGYYAGEGTSAYFWSSTEFNTDFELRGAYYMMLWDANNYVYLDDTGDPNRRNFYTNYGYSVRCIKKD